jgi:hypothetical protein
MPEPPAWNMLDIVAVLAGNNRVCVIDVGAHAEPWLRYEIADTHATFYGRSRLCRTPSISSKQITRT